MAESISILMLIILMIIGCIIYLKREHDKKFGIWFEEVIKLAPVWGFTQKRIDEFEEIFWWDYFCLEMTPEQAIKQYLADN